MTKLKVEKVKVPLFFLIGWLIFEKSGWPIFTKVVAESMNHYGTSITNMAKYSEIQVL